MGRGAIATLSLALVLTGSSSFAADDETRPGEELIAAQVRALEAEPVVAGGEGELSLILLERADPALPLAVRVDSVEGLELEHNRLGWSAVVDPLALQPRLRASFRAPEQPGRYTVEAGVDYSVCPDAGEQSDWCRRKHGRVRWTVIVRPATPAE